ncbi:MAG: cytochrome c [Sedimentisphaerales bacterium]|jgi:mono/diheme cytochrome c family protein
MKKSNILLLVVALVAAGTFVVFAADQPVGGGMMGGGMMRGGGMMGGGMMGGQTTTRQSSEWEAPPAEAERKNPVPSSRESIAAGKSLFEDNCVYCHGANAKGNALAPNLTGSAVQNQTDGTLFWKISNGKSPMPAFADVLTERQRWNVINFIRSLASQTSQNAVTTQTRTTSSAQNITTTTRGPVASYPVMMMNSMGMMMSRSSIIPASDGGVIVMMGNQLLKYDSNLNLVKSVEIKFDWQNWQKTMMDTAQQ